MLTLTNFLTVAGAAASTTALVALLKDIWKAAPEPWVTWALAEGTVLIGGVLRGPLSGKEVLLLAVSGMVVAATALGSQAGVQKLITKA
ncbi:MAG: hypothetical protein M0Z36_02650 [Thermaerobacter sp.]|nr:hypothetical protein [Thermaerobacter sp.]